MNNIILKNYKFLVSIRLAKLIGTLIALILIPLLLYLFTANLKIVDTDMWTNIGRSLLIFVFRTSLMGMLTTKFNKWGFDVSLKEFIRGFKSEHDKKSKITFFTAKYYSHRDRNDKLSKNKDNNLNI
jgi:predicted Na+-dependent transporter